MVKILGEVTCDLTNMPASAFKKKNNAAFPRAPRIGLPVPVTKATFQIDMRMGSADIDLELVYDKQSFGKARIEY